MRIHEYFLLAYDFLNGGTSAVRTRIKEIELRNLERLRQQKQDFGSFMIHTFYFRQWTLALVMASCVGIWGLLLPVVFYQSAQRMADEVYVTTPDRVMKYPHVKKPPVRSLSQPFPDPILVLPNRSGSSSAFDSSAKKKQHDQHNHDKHRFGPGTCTYK